MRDMHIREQVLLHWHIWSDHVGLFLLFLIDIACRAYTLFPAFATIFSTCLFHVRSLEMVTPRSLAYCTLSISFPSIINLGTVLLTSGSCIKLISISFDLSELIFMSLCIVSTSRCQWSDVWLIHSFYGIFQTAYCRLHIYTTGQAFLDHLYTLENI